MRNALAKCAVGEEHTSAFSRLDQPTHKTCQPTLIFPTVFLRQKFCLCPSLLRAQGAGTGWGDRATTPQCLACPLALHPCRVSKNAPDAQSTGAIFGLVKAVTCHTGDTHAACSGRLSALFLLSCLDFRLKQEANKQNKPRIPTLCTLRVGGAKCLQESRDASPSHTFCKKLQLQNSRNPAAFYLGNLRGRAGKKPKPPLFPRSSHPQRKSQH